MRTTHAILSVSLCLGLGQPAAHAGVLGKLLGGGNDRHEGAMQAAPQKIKITGWRKDLLQMRSDAERGKMRFGDVFSKQKLFTNIASGREQQLGFDSESGAKSATDPRSKFVLIRDFMAQQGIKESYHNEHVLAVATPSDAQPISIFDVAPQKAEHLGRMMRGVLRADQVQARRGQFPSWFAHVSLPDKISIPYLHIHGEETVGAAFTPTLDSSKVRDWRQFLGQNQYNSVHKESGFEVFAGPANNSPSGWEVVAVADASLAPKGLSAADDALLGKMVLQVGEAAVAPGRGVTAGHIEVTRDDSRLVVRAVNYGSHAFDKERAELEKLRREREAKESR
jgi:hypothetical protein